MTTLDSPHPQTQPPNLLRIVYNLALFFGAVLLFLAYYRITFTQPIEADEANAVVEGLALSHGNLLLHHWVLTNVSFYFTDILWYGVGVALFGPSVELIHIIPCLIYFMVVALAMFLAGRNASGRTRLWAMGLTLILLGFPARVASKELHGIIHVGTVVFLLLAFLAMDDARRRNIRLPWLRYLCVFVLLSMADASDTMTLFVGIVPCLLVSLLRWMRVPPERRATEAGWFIAALGAAIAGKGFLSLMTAVHGFQTMPVEPFFVALSHLGNNLVLTLGGILALFDADFFGEFVSLHSLLMLVCTLGVALIARTVWSIIAQWYQQFQQENRLDTERPSGDRLVQTLTAVVVMNLGTFLFSSMANDIYSARYLMPCAACGAILAGRVGASTVQRSPFWRWGMAAVGLAMFALFAQQLRLPRASEPSVPVAAWLLSHGLTNGYGSYWDSAVTTLRSEGRVQVSPVLTNGRPIHPYYWFVDQNWYHAPAHFLIFDTDSKPSDVSLQTATQTFGPPDSSVQIGPETILVWTKDISPILRRLPGEPTP